MLDLTNKNSLKKTSTLKYEIKNECINKVKTYKMIMIKNVGKHNFFVVGNDLELCKNVHLSTKCD